MASKPKVNPIIIIIICSFFFQTCYSQNNSSLRPMQLMRDWEQLTSPNGNFRMQFFSLGSSPNRYLGIFYNVPSYDGNAVWVANRNTPISDASGTLFIDSDVRLKISSSAGTIPIVLNSISLSPTANLNATLLDTGNFVLSEMNQNGSLIRVLWESFDYPTDTLLPGMKLGINFRTGHVWSLTSWRSDVLPAQGSFTFGADPNNTSTQFIIRWRGNIAWRSGPWRDGTFQNVLRSSIEAGFEFSFVSNADEKYLTYSVNGNLTNSRTPRYTMLPNGQIHGWSSGLFSSCFPTNGTSVPIPPGCEDYGWPECRRKDYWFFTLQQGVLSGNGFTYDDKSNMSLFDCETACRNNCSCTAYAATTYNRTGCTLYGQEVNLQKTLSSLDQAYMVRQFKVGIKQWVRRLIASVSLILLLLFSLCCCVAIRRCRRRDKRRRAQERLLIELENNGTSTPFSQNNYYTKDEKMSEELHSFSFETIAAATNNFSSEDKLGEGGFGPVYKGLLDGQELAIKRLSKSSGQGLEEFKNEILLIAKLQHTNLVRLIGCCIHGQEKILVYEYMPNKSLDYFLFHPDRKDLLNWTTRFNIIEGIAQGLLYLHKYSRLRIIHRDLKASNILLDSNFNPKISDFGMARIFGVNVSEANTIRVVGTYGYMSPEYAMNGIFSMKSDVYSFGVLLLEIVSSRRNNSGYHSECQLNLIGLAWELWNEGKAVELIDATMEDCLDEQARRCIQVSLLCAQDKANDRPSMAEVVSMLTNERMSLPRPKKPAFFIDTSSSPVDHTSRTHDTSGNCSINELTISMMHAR